MHKVLEHWIGYGSQSTKIVDIAQIATTGVECLSSYFLGYIVDKSCNSSFVVERVSDFCFKLLV